MSLENAKENSRRIENFESKNSDDYMEYSVVKFNKAGDFHTGFIYLNKAVELNATSHLGYRGWIRLRKIRDYDNALSEAELIAIDRVYKRDNNVSLLIHKEKEKAVKEIEC